MADESLLSDMIKVVFIMVSNVVKLSAVNKFLNEKRMIVNNVPGIKWDAVSIKFLAEILEKWSLTLPYVT